MRIDQHWDTCAAHMGAGCSCGLDTLHAAGNEAERQIVCRGDFYRGLGAGLLVGCVTSSVCWVVVMALVGVQS